MAEALTMNRHEDDAIDEGEILARRSRGKSAAYHAALADHPPRPTGVKPIPHRRRTPGLAEIRAGEEAARREGD
jgi:hypothetical protein